MGSPIPTGQPLTTQVIIPPMVSLFLRALSIIFINLFAKLLSGHLTILDSIFEKSNFL